MAAPSNKEQNTHLHVVDWSSLPAPKDDGGAEHLVGLSLPHLELAATDGKTVDLSKLVGTIVIFAYPRTGRPDQALPNGWDMIPGARGCTPQACAFRDIHDDLKSAGADAVYGLSTQSIDYQREAVQRLHLPFPLLCDETLALTKALNLPTMDVEGMVLIKRLTLIVRNQKIIKTFYPVFPPDRSANDVLAWLTTSKETT